MTLNMLRRLRINPILSAYTQIFGFSTTIEHHWYRLVQEQWYMSALHRKTGPPLDGDHGVIGWTIGPALDHYRHWDFYIPKTRVSDTVVFLPEIYNMPTTASGQFRV
jgi:hypothetical protein